MMGINSKKPLANRWQNLLVEFPLMLLMCTSLACLFVLALDLRQTIYSVVLINLICLGVWTIAFATRRTVIISFVLVLIGVSIGATLYFVRSSSVEITEIQGKMDAFLYWASTYLKGFRTDNLPYKRLLAIIICVLFSLLISFFTVRKFDLIAAITPGAACFVALLIIGHTIDMPILFCYILAATLYFLLHSYKKNSSERYSVKPPQPALFMASALPLALLVLTITIIMSSLVKLDPEWMKDIRDKILKKDNKVNEYIINNADTPVLSTAELGGNIVLGDTVVMQVTSPISNVYLRGVSKDVYTGHSWEQSDTTPSAFNSAINGFEETDETARTILTGIGNNDLAGNLLQMQNITIQYKNFSTGTIYIPLKAISIEGISHILQMDRIGKDSYMLSKSNAPADYKYNVQYYSVNNESPGFSGFIQDWFDGKYDWAENLNAPIFYNEQYTVLPPALPARVSELALEITKNAKNDYEKARAIEKYFSENDFTYTLSPGGYDKSEDFVDQFLFVNKKGYCTYYATAMAILLRCAGIPSRYVEGYVLPAKEQDSDVYNVTQKQGHAWVEAYFTGLGWLQFEPTSAYAGGARPANTPEPTASPRPSRTPLPTNSTNPNDPEDKPVSTEVRGVNLILPLSIFLCAVLLAALLYIPYHNARAMQKLLPREAALLLNRQYMDLLSIQGIKPEGSETSALFSRRADNLLGLQRHGLSKVSLIFQLARYSDHEVTVEQKQQMLAFRKELLAASRKKLGFIRALYFKWLWMS